MTRILGIILLLVILRMAVKSFSAQLKANRLASGMAVSNRLQSSAMRSRGCCGKYGTSAI